MTEVTKVASVTFVTEAHLAAKKVRGENRVSIQAELI
jgi:hypothetical protein